MDITTIDVPADIENDIEPVKLAYEKFDHFMGALALMKSARMEGCNVSPLYIDTLSKFNTLIAQQKNEVKNVNNKYHNFFDSQNSVELMKSIDMSMFENIAHKNNQKIVKDNITKVIDPTNLEQIVYVYYVLYTYGVGEESKRKKIDELILNNFNGLKEGKGESCAFYYGYNRGYAVFNNQYKGENKTEIVKFQLNSLLDHYTIESVFEYCFHNKVASNIDFLDQQEWNGPSRKLRRGEYIILDTIIRDKKKAILLSDEWWADCLQSFLSKDSLTILGKDLTPLIKDKVLNPFAKIVKEEYENEHNDTLSDVKDKYNEKIHSLEISLKEKEQQIENMQQKIANVQCPETIPYSVNPECVEELVSKIVDLATMKSADRKERAKKYGCSIKQKSDTKTLIMQILQAEQNNPQKIL